MAPGLLGNKALRGQRASQNTPKQPPRPQSKALHGQKAPQKTPKQPIPLQNFRVSRDEEFRLLRAAVLEDRALDAHAQSMLPLLSNSPTFPSLAGLAERKYDGEIIQTFAEIGGFSTSAMSKPPAEGFMAVARALAYPSRYTGQSATAYGCLLTNSIAYAQRLLMLSEFWGDLDQADEGSKPTRELLRQAALDFSQMLDGATEHRLNAVDPTSMRHYISELALYHLKYKHARDLVDNYKNAPKLPTPLAMINAVYVDQVPG